MTELVNEFAEFLRGSKIAEMASSELRQAISVETGLEASLTAALRSGADTVVAGSAGGGKTHLLDASLKQLRDDDGIATWVWKPGTAPPGTPYVQTVPDFTEVSHPDRSAALTRVDDNCHAIAIAANEGPLLGEGRADPKSKFRAAVDLLHAGQRGETKPYEGSSPTVVDVGGFDPVDAGVTSRMLRLELLSAVVRDTSCTCEARPICPRQQAWKQLQTPGVAQRVDELLRIVGVDGRPLIFRQLWDFVADLTTGGTCSGDVPTSPWFWRVFYGDNAVSRRLRELVEPRLLVFPGADAHLYYGDWDAEELGLVEGADFLPLPSRPDDADSFTWTRVQLFFLSSEGSAATMVRDQIDLDLMQAVDAARTLELVGAINSYTSYGTRKGTRERLALMTDIGVERRTDRPRSQVVLGEVRSNHLQIQRSQAVMNHPSDDAGKPGNRYFLVHPATGATFRLSTGALSLLKSGRSYRTSDRSHTDMEWFLSGFFGDIAAGTDWDQLGVMHVDFDSLTSVYREYHVSPESHYIEQAG